MTMTQHLKIDFVSDIVCPWCAIGLGGLEQALAALAGEVTADIRFEPFELNPHMPPEGEDLGEHIHKKYGSTPEESAENRQRITARAAEVGYTFNYGPESRIYNTFDAHRLLHWAELEGRQAELKKVLLKAYFTEQRNPASHEVLIAAAVAAGLDAGKAREVLESDAHAQTVRARESLWRRRGITGVPAIIINDRHLINGGQPPAVFEELLRRIAQDAEAPAA
ncbi:MAG: DsbA family oxidoreductase [Nevskia sp.]